MRSYTETTTYYQVDSGDQPRARYVLFTPVAGAWMCFRVDGLDHGPGIADTTDIFGYRTNDEGERVDVIRIPEGHARELVEASYLEAETTRERHLRHIEEARYAAAMKMRIEKATQEGMIQGQAFAVSPPPQDPRQPNRRYGSGIDEFRKIMEEGFGGETDDRA